VSSRESSVTRVATGDCRLATGDCSLRLDLFLKASRLCPRRTIAQKICEAGRVSINGTSAKSSHVVKPGDEITLSTRSRITRFRVLAVPSARQTSRKEAATLYEVLSEELLDESEL
ncbi:MAG: RNA-binding S4 domain-containing protein, partial [Acidobacteriota bacterium]|nr:RNA-binding S4 domain-containing protein [Acidobacteriota bacterium]